VSLYRIEWLCIAIVALQIISVDAVVMGSVPLIVLCFVVFLILFVRHLYEPVWYDGYGVK